MYVGGPQYVENFGKNVVLSSVITVKENFAWEIFEFMTLRDFEYVWIFSSEKF